MSPSPPLFSEAELDVADVLSNLSFYINHDSHRCLLSGIPGWGSHKPRSALALHDGVRRLPKQKEHLQLPLVASETKTCCRDAPAFVSSPATTLSFPGSSPDENESIVVPMKLPKGKSHKQFVEEQKVQIVSLSDENAKLRKIVDKYREIVQRELTKNKIYRQAQLAAANPELMNCSGQRPNPPMDPTVLTTHQSSPAVDHRVDAQLQMLKPSAMAMTSGVRENISLLDLNVVPAEAVVDELQLQPQQYLQQQQLRQQLLPNLLVKDKAAQARKRRLEIQREKNLMSNLLSPPLMKVSRLR